MLDGLMGRGFSSKCKSLIKPTRTRLDALLRREEATQKFLKGNLAQLLSKGLDDDAYGRVVKQSEDFLAGLNLLSCFFVIEQSCEYILKQLPAMQKQRECPEECREAVGSLMFAAAWLSDLPELRDLRDTFQERYGNSYEQFVNQEFVGKLALGPPTMEKKLQLLQDIASEFSIKWDSRGFEQRIANPPVSAQDQPKKNGPLNDHGDKVRLLSGMDTVTGTENRNHSSKKKAELTDDTNRMSNGREDNPLKGNEDCCFSVREELTSDNVKPYAGWKQSTPKRDQQHIPFRGRQELADNKHEPLNGKVDTVIEKVRPGHSPRGEMPQLVDSGHDLHNHGMNGVGERDKKLEVAARVDGVPRRRRDGKDVSSAGYSNYGQPDTLYSTGRVQEEDTDRLKSSHKALPPPYIKSKDKFVPPPYTKSKDGKYGVSSVTDCATSKLDTTSMDPSLHENPNAVQRSDRNQRESNDQDYEAQVVRSVRVRSHGPEKDEPYRVDKDTVVVKGSSSSRRKDNSRRGLQHDGHSQKDEEEMVMDRLLLHYSKKPSSYPHEKVRRKSKAHAPHQVATDACKTVHYSRNGPDIQAEKGVPPIRTVSLPDEQTAPSEAVNVIPRANSYQPDEPAPCAHPKLPNYENLAAQFAAMRRP